MGSCTLAGKLRSRNNIDNTEYHEQTWKKCKAATHITTTVQTWWDTLEEFWYQSYLLIMAEFDKAKIQGSKLRLVPHVAHSVAFRRPVCRSVPSSFPAQPWEDRSPKWLQCVPAPALGLGSPLTCPDGQSTRCPFPM